MDQRVDHTRSTTSLTLVTHSKLLIMPYFTDMRLDVNFSIRDNALNWFASYLT